MVVGTGMAPVVGNEEQQHGIDAEEEDADQPEQDIPLREMIPQVGP